MGLFFRAFVCAVVLVSWCINARGQQPALDGVYIPISIEDAIAELKKSLPTDDLAKLRLAPEEDMALYHHGLGTWIRNNWGLWKGSRLQRYFYELGIYHPDDMSGIVLTSFKRHLDGKPMRVSAQVRETRSLWARGGRQFFWCPWDKSKVQVRAYLPSTLHDGVPAQVSLGRCRAAGHLWAERYETGEFRLTGDMLKQAKKAEATATKPWR